MRDYGLEAQRAAEAHLEAIYEAEFENEGEDSPSIGPWDGCTTCVVREVLMVAWPFLEHAALQDPPAPMTVVPDEEP